MLIELQFIFIGCFILERAFVGWELSKVKTWPIRVILINIIQLGVVIFAGITWETWFSSWPIFNLSDYLSPILGA